MGGDGASPSTGNLKAGRAGVRAAAISDSIGELPALERQVRRDLQVLSYPARPWMKGPRQHTTGSHVYDVAIIGGGQCGLTTAFGLTREQVANIVVLDENPAGLEGPWVTYARMVTLRTNKSLTGPDLGVASLTFQSYYEAKCGSTAWQELDKIPKGEWMAYLMWYRRVLNLPVRNNTKVQLIERDPDQPDLFRLSLAGSGASREGEGGGSLLARKVVLATGIQGGGEWHVPSLVAESVPKAMYAHTCEAIDFVALRGKRIAILGGGASAFDNAQHALELGVGAVELFVRRPELPRINPIRFMESAGFLRHFSDLSDDEKYAGIDYFLQFNQPPTNDTFNRAARFPNFNLHTGAGWQQLKEEAGQVRVVSARGDHGLFDFLIISTGLLTDARLRPELRSLAPDIATWSDRYSLPPSSSLERNPIIDAHPYLGPNFQFTEKVPGTAPHISGLFAFNYSALASLGLSASALSGMKYAMPKLLLGITRQLFLEDKQEVLGELLSYDTPEFVGTWPMTTERRRQLQAELGGCTEAEGDSLAAAGAEAAAGVADRATEALRTVEVAAVPLPCH